MFEALVGAELAQAIGDITYDRIEDRFMGLVPHEFKALIVRQPSG